MLPYVCGVFSSVASLISSFQMSVQGWRKGTVTFTEAFQKNGVFRELKDSSDHLHLSLSLAMHLQIMVQKRNLEKYEECKL